MHNKYKALESCWNHLPQSQFVEKLSSIKPVSGCKKVRDCKYGGWGLWDDHKTMSVYKLVFMGLKTPLLENWIHWLLCLVALSCHTLCNNMDCSLPGSSAHGDSPGKNIGVGCHALFQGIFPTQGSNPGLLHCRYFTVWVTITKLSIKQAY